MVRAELNEKMDDIKVEMHGDARAVSTETMYLVKLVGDQLEKHTGISARTHIVNMCKLIVEDDMTMTQTMRLAEKTMDGEEDLLDELAAPDKITELQERLEGYLRNYRNAREMFPESVNHSYDTGWNNALCWVLRLTGKNVNKADYGLAE